MANTACISLRTLRHPLLPVQQSKKNQEWMAF